MSPNPAQTEEAIPPPNESTEEADLPKTPPPPPNPSHDRTLAIETPDSTLEPITSPELNAQPDNIFDVPPLAALKLLSAGVEALVRITGDIPPTPPPSTPHMPNMRGMQAEKESIQRNLSERSLARLREQAIRDTARAAGSPSKGARQPIPGSPLRPTPATRTSSSKSVPMPGQQTPVAPIDGVRLRTPTPAPTPDLAPPSTPEPYIIVGDDSQPLNMQHSAITRKFYSKKPPPIGITDYLLRIHRFCPMSTAVYLATSLYIHRLAVNERAIAVTKRNAHRLLLAGLRVAMKALEDLSYPHGKVAKVGGVSELELARLEISFCFLCSFELVVGKKALTDHWMTMRSGRSLNTIGQMDGAMPLPNLTIRRGRTPSREEG